MECLADRAQYVIEYFAKDDSIDTSRIILVGHSQGALEGARVAEQCSLVTDLVYLNSNPFGRETNNALYLRHHYNEKGGPNDSLFLELAKSYAQCRDLYESKEVLVDSGDSFITKKSFGRSVLPYLMSTDANIYFIFGTEDIRNDLMDIVPFLLISSGKTNFDFFPYLGVEHNFFEVNDEGKVDYRKPHWNDVIMKILNWLEKEK